MAYHYNSDGSTRVILPGDEVRKITTTIGQGKDGKIIYPMGSYSNWLKTIDTSNYSKIECNATSAPYLYDDGNLDTVGSRKYYVYNAEVDWYSVIADDAFLTTISSYIKSNPDQPYWVEMDSFNAMYAEIGIIENGMIGDAVYNNGFIFSQSGTDEGSDDFSDFNPGSDRDPYNDPGNPFKPNMLLDLRSGSAFFGGGTTVLSYNGNDNIFNRVSIGAGTHIDNNGISCKPSNATLVANTDGSQITYSGNGIVINNDGINVLANSNMTTLSDYIVSIILDYVNNNTRTYNTTRRLLTTDSGYSDALKTMILTVGGSSYDYDSFNSGTITKDISIEPGGSSSVELSLSYPVVNVTVSENPLGGTTENNPSILQYQTNNSGEFVIETNPSNSISASYSNGAINITKLGSTSGYVNISVEPALIPEGSHVINIMINVN